MSERWKPVGVGLGTGIVLLALPDVAAAPALVAGALLAGWVTPSAPMLAAVLFFAPTLVLGAVRLTLDDMAPHAGALALGLLSAVMFTAIFTHVGAGLALRSSETPD